MDGLICNAFTIVSNIYPSNFGLNCLNSAIISDKKKHYVGWTGTEGEEPEIKGMEGKKNDRPKWLNDTFSKVVRDILVNKTNPLHTLQEAISDLEEGKVSPDLLEIE